jgi:release factor glutamine methyltransferase
MLTVLEAINLSTEYLEKRGIESPRLNSELLLADVLHCKRLELYLKFDKPLDIMEVNTLRDYIKRRGKYEPLQYILGKTEFYNLTFKVDRRVLIPRQETEILIDEIINSIPKSDSYSILDIGTGSGNIIISLAANIPNCKFTAVDICNDAIAVAIENAKLNSVENKIEFIQKDILNISATEFGKFDIVVANPPYISLEDYKKLQKEIVEYEPIKSLTDFADGFEFYRKICSISKTLLKSNGKLFFEIGVNQKNVIQQIMEENGLLDIYSIKDYLNIERVLAGVKR